LKEYRALLVECRARLAQTSGNCVDSIFSWRIECRDLFIEYRALLVEYRAFLTEYRALLSQRGSTFCSPKFRDRCRVGLFS